MANIYNDKFNTLLSGTSGNDTIKNGGSWDNSWHDGGSNVTINTGEGKDSVDNWGSSVTINTGAGNDYVYNRGDSVTISGGKGNDTIINNCYSDLTPYDDNDGSNVTFKYAEGDGKDIIYGFKSNSTLSIAGSYSSITSGSNIILTVGEGKITLVGAASLSKVNVKGTNAPAPANSWKISGTTATYGTSSNTLITVSGVKSLSGLSVSGKVVTVAQSALGTNKITISDGYTLKLASDVANKSSTSNAWTFDKKKSTATYAQTNKAYYTLAGDKKSITYNKASSKNLVTVSGVKSASGLTLSGKTVTVAQSSLGTNKITISDGYTLKLADGVPISKSTSVSWTHDGTKAAYKSAGTTAGYTLSNNAITYSSAKAASTLATVNGVKSNVDPTVKNKVITLTKNNLSSNKVMVNGSGYEFNFAKGDYANTTITGSKIADKITSNGNNLVINGGKGNDSISLNSAAKNNLIVYSNGDGNDIINGLTSDDTIKISGTAKVTTNGDDVIFTVGKGKITVKEAADKIFSYIANGKTETYTTVVADPYTISGAAITFSNSYTKKDFDVTKDVKGGKVIVTIDASAVNHDFNITGNAKANEIIGGAGNDTLDGYSGNDTLTGGDGADIFIYYSGDGNDVISDYEAKDTIQIYDGKVTPSTKGRDVILKVGNEKITVQNAAKNKIGVTYTEDGVEYDYLNGEQTVIMNEKKTYATITKNYWKTGFDFANFGKSLQKADASAVTHALNITGNDKANVILGGSGKNTLTGGTGNDTLQGGDKADIFLYNKGDGNDKILGYGESDIISIASGAVNNVTVKGDTVILTVGKGKISVDGETNITYYDANGRTSKIFSKENTNVVEPLWFAENNFAENNQLSSIVQSESADYSFLNGSTSLILEKNFIAYGEKKSRG